MTAETLVWVAERPVSGPKKPQQSRRSHRKSRNGCLTCKTRRVKCDERHPICGPCSLRATECTFTDLEAQKHAPDEHSAENSSIANSSARSTVPRPHSLKGPRQDFTAERKHAKSYPRSGGFAPATRRSILPSRSATSTLAQESALGIHAVSSHIASLVSSSARNASSANTLPYLISHFTNHSTATLSSYTGQSILRNKVPELLLRHELLLHAVLAFAASHLEYLQHSYHTTGCGSPSRLARTAAWHSQRALRLYGDKIGWYQAKAAHPQGIKDGDFWFRLLAGDSIAGQSSEEREDMDAMVASCIMLTSLFFHCPWADEKGFARSWTKSILPSSRPKGGRNGIPVSPSCSIFATLPQIHEHDRATAPDCNTVLDHHRSDSSSTAYRPTWTKLTIGSTSGPSSQFMPASSNKQQINWLTTITGMAILLSLPAFQKNLQESIWFPFLREANNKQESQQSGRDPAFDTAILNISHDASPSQDTGQKNLLEPGRPPGNHNSLTGYTPEISSSVFMDEVGRDLDCSQIIDPRYDTKDRPGRINAIHADPGPRMGVRNGASLCKLHQLTTLMANDSDPSLYKQQKVLHPILSHLVHLLSLDPTNLTNFSPIISFPSRLPPDFLSSFQLDEKTTDSTRSSPKPDMDSTPDSHSSENSVPSTDGSNDIDKYINYSGLSSYGSSPTGSGQPNPSITCRPGTLQNSDVEFPTTDLCTAPAGKTPMAPPTDIDALLETTFASHTSDTNLAISAEPAYPTEKQTSGTAIGSTLPSDLSGRNYNESCAQTCSTLTNSATPSFPAATTDKQMKQKYTVVVPLLLLGYWFTTLAQVPHWWCAERGSLESEVVVDALLKGFPAPAGLAQGGAATAAGPPGSVSGKEKDRQLEEATQQTIREFVEWRRTRMSARGNRSGWAN